MEFKTGEIQPIVSDPWTIAEFGRKESQVVPPVVRAEGSVSRKIGDRPQSSEAQPEQMKSEYLAQVVAKVRDFFEEALNISLDFHVDAETDEVVVRLVNRETGEVVRQIPPEDLFKVRDKLDELRGVLFNGKV